MESDSLTAVRLLNLRCPQLHPNYSLVCEIHSLLRLDDGSSISYVPRETNQTADCFAKDGLNLDSGSTIYDLLPSFADLAGVSFP